MRLMWHGFWMRFYGRRADRAQLRMQTALVDARRHRTMVFPAEAPGELTWSVTTSSTPHQEIDLRPVPVLQLVPDPPPDEPDSPEADHLFWESTAEDHLGDWR